MIPLAFYLLVMVVPPMEGSGPPVEGAMSLVTMFSKEDDCMRFASDALRVKGGIKLFCIPAKTPALKVP